jgi:hypothetical protein
MSEQVVSPQVPRVRVAAAQSAKGVWQVKCTVESFDGTDPVPLLAAKIKEVESTLKAEGKRLASDAA